MHATPSCRRHHAAASVPTHHATAGNPCPLNAGSFEPNALDATFSLQVMFRKAPAGQNTSPYGEIQIFSEVNIDARTRALTVDLRDLIDRVLFSNTRTPA